MAPGAVSDPLKPVLDAAMQGQLDQRKLDKMLVDAATQTEDRRLQTGSAVTRGQRRHPTLPQGVARWLCRSRTQ